MRKLLLVAIVATLCVGCENPPEPVAPSQINIFNQNTNNNGGTNPGASPSPGANCATVASVRVGFFGVRCSGGVAPPRNGEGRLPMGCLGDATATPKTSTGSDVPSSVHGQNIVWAVEAGAGRVRLVDEQEAFNKTVVPEAVGEVVVSATVTPPGCGPIKGQFSFQVTSAAATSMEGPFPPGSPPPRFAPLDGNPPPKDPPPPTVPGSGK